MVESLFYVILTSMPGIVSEEENVCFGAEVVKIVEGLE